VSDTKLKIAKNAAELPDSLPARCGRFEMPRKIEGADGGSKLDEPLPHAFNAGLRLSAGCRLCGKARVGPFQIARQHPQSRQVWLVKWFLEEVCVTG
jgi:hypothetical protein